MKKQLLLEDGWTTDGLDRKTETELSRLGKEQIGFSCDSIMENLAIEVTGNDFKGTEPRTTHVIPIKHARI